MKITCKFELIRWVLSVLLFLFPFGKKKKGKKIFSPLRKNFLYGFAKEKLEKGNPYKGAPL